MNTVQERRKTRAVRFLKPNQGDANQQDQPKRPERGRPGRRWLWVTLAAVSIVASVALGLLTQPQWLPTVMTLADQSPEPADPDHSQEHAHDQPHDSATGHGHEDQGEAHPDDHDHAEHDDTTAIELSESARRNIGLKLATVERRDYQRTASMPGVLAERPGRSKLLVSAPLTGVVQTIYPTEGEAVSPGDALFRLRLTHEDLVEKQSSLLRAVEELDVVNREVARLEKVTRSGAVAGKRLLEREYEQQKIEAAIRAQRQALLLHGLSSDQIDQIIEQRELLRSLDVTAPAADPCDQTATHEVLLQVVDISVAPGEHVSAGTRLGVLANHCELYVQGRAFEDDADALNHAAVDNAPITVVIGNDDSERREVSDLRILYVENEIERDSRALRFYLRLPNALVRNEVSDTGHRFIGWRYRPGQRVEVLVPMDRWGDRLVVPVEAVVQEGAESYLYELHDDHFHRRTVHVVHRDQRFAVIDSGGEPSAGDVVAARGAYQIHLALKNEASGGVDPHAGHHH